MAARVEYKDVFQFDGKNNILCENDFGIVNGRITIGIDYTDMFSISGIWAPPYASSDFSLQLRMFGEKVPVTDYVWQPFKVDRKGYLNGINMASTTLLAEGMKAIILRFTLENTAPETKKIPLQLIVKGGIDYVHLWDFARAAGIKSTDAILKGNQLIKVNNNKVIIIDTGMDRMKWHEPSGQLESEIVLEAGMVRSFHIVIAIGEKSEAVEVYDKIGKNPQKAMEDACSAYERTVKNIFNKLPAFDASDKRLVDFYNRSLVHYATNCWQVPEFVLHPCYTTGSIKGGCLASYLWDYAEGWETHPLFDPDATKEHIRQYLKIDITNSYSFDPMTGIALGPWYPVNQEKIIGLIYYYILHTGDLAFLNETAGDKTVLEWTVAQATFGDDMDGPAALIDYGNDGEHHLELRRGYSYHGVMPDLNGRRYLSYIRASELLDLCGKSSQDLRERAETIKNLLKEHLWCKEERWFHFIAGSEKMLRYTIQMFKLINSSVLDNEERQGLLSHLNEKEFLSPYGMHSMSKEDPAYDQIDIDNGGGGSCTVFPPQIVEFLYKSGYPAFAEDILKRILWWGDKTPYWGDSFVANYKGYRDDTPLQCTIGGVTGAQCLIFGMFGVTPMMNGNVVIDPHPPTFSHFIELKGLKIRECIMDIHVEGDTFKLVVNDQSILSKVGEAVIYDAETKKIKKRGIEQKK